MFNKQHFISPTEPFTPPPYHHQVITIPQPNNDYIFTRNTYNPHLLSPYITKTDYNKIIDNAEKVISQSMISKRKYEEVKVPRFVYILFFSAIISFIIYMLTLYYAPRRSNGKTLYTVSIIFAVIGICIAIGLSVYNICRKIRSGKDLNDFVESDLNLFFGKVNENGSPNVKFQYYDTICRQVSNRLDNIRRFAESHNLILFVCGKKSSNGKVLYQECLKANPNSFHIEGSHEIDFSLIKDGLSVGICGATSTPKWLMEECKQAIINHKI